MDALKPQYDDPDDTSPYDDDFDEPDDEFDCHRGRDGSCGLAGTEECEFDCPYNR